ncbi:hypothetical protein K0M31_014042 [Melipona bicolor]|uniref:Chitin-binding type-2 domain-containing protein n=1 Tax=Melipona bicolor TaxID=60889 RepID=A0AA40G7T4_9HYME|nr:hypothetical protein K0M31_014042 [Melipona bicolor]
MMNFFSTLIVIVMLCTLSFTKLNAKYVQVYQIDKLKRMKQEPPEDPAINSFTTEPPPLLPSCTRAGYFRDPFNCKKFYHCEHARAIPMGYYCEANLIFNPYTLSCDNPQYVIC